MKIRSQWSKKDQDNKPTESGNPIYTTYQRINTSYGTIELKPTGTGNLYKEIQENIEQLIEPEHKKSLELEEWELENKTKMEYLIKKLELEQEKLEKFKKEQENLIKEKQEKYKKFKEWEKDQEKIRKEKENG